MGDGVVTLFLSGDVMTGRGVDQILAHPGDPRLWEPNVTDARAYVELAEAANGPIRRPVDYRWPWGDALHVLDGDGLGRTSTASVARSEAASITARTGCCGCSYNRAGVSRRTNHPPIGK